MIGVIARLGLVLALTSVLSYAAVPSYEKCFKMMTSKLCMRYHPDALDGCKDGLEVNIHKDTVCLFGSKVQCLKTIDICVKILEPQMVNSQIKIEQNRLNLI